MVVSENPVDLQLPIVLSHVQVRPLLVARSRGATTATASLDLGLSTSPVLLGPDGVTLPDGQTLCWATLEEIVEQENACFAVRDNAATKIQVYSPEFGRFYSLMPTSEAPTVLISGVLMHRIKGVGPYQDTLLKIGTIAPIVGRALDTATGLGYTAVEAAKTADEVVTIEIDPAMQEVARQNPWSRGLFTRPNIRRRFGDAAEVVPTLPSGSFARIVHDPPTLSLGGQLYSAAFYGELYRVLTRGGRMFHYIGDLDSKYGRGVAQGALRRLREVGFQRVVPKPKAFGLVAQK